MAAEVSQESNVVDYGAAEPPIKPSWLKADPSASGSPCTP